MCSTFCKKMNARIEKNRKHLATLVAAIIGIAIILALNQVWTLPSQQLFWAFIAVLAVRSVVVESGLRRQANKFEKRLDSIITQIADKHFGIAVLPHDEKPDITGDESKKSAEQAAPSNR